MGHWFSEQIIADDIPNLTEGLVAALSVSELALHAAVPHSKAAAELLLRRILLATRKFKFWQTPQMLLQFVVVQMNITM